jgi:thiamine-phosphate pyrophosphorylase
VVTDRRQLAGRVGRPLSDWPALLGAQITGCLTAGADLIQVREPDLEAGPLARFLTSLFDHVPDSVGRVVVNDRADVVLATRAAGVHLGECSLGLDDVRLLEPADKRWVIGRSVHAAATAAACRSASFLIAGTVRASSSKPRGWRVLGWEGLAEIVQAAGTTPVVAIGGIDESDVPAVVRCGAVGVAGISCFLPEPGADIGAGARDRVRAVINAFDTVGGETYTRSTGG